MSLEEKYLTAAQGTYVGTVRYKQAPYAPSGAPNSDAGIVNYMDGTKRTSRAPDEFQSEFKRNEPGAFVVGGAQGVLRASTDMLTRWTDKAFNLAFQGKNKGTSALRNGYYDDERYRTATGPSGKVTVHNYAPLANKKYSDLNSSAKAKIDANAALSPKI